MDFDIAGLLSNPDVLYMMAGLGGAIGKDNPLAVAAGGMTQQGIAAQNQAAWVAKLLGLGGAPKAEGITEGLGGWPKIRDTFLKAAPDTTVSTDGKTATLKGSVDSFGSLAGGGTPATPQQPTMASGGQPGIINPSVGLPGDLSGLSLAGLKPEDINNAITLGLTGADLERKKVSDLYQSQYRKELVREKALARGAKSVLAPFEIPGVGPVTLDQLKAMPTGDVAYAYAMHLRKQNGQPMISPEQFKMQASPSDMEKLARAVMSDPKLFGVVKELKQAGAINLGDLGVRQEQHEIIKNWADIGTPKHRASLMPTKEERRSIEKQVEAKAVGKNNDEYEKILSNALEEHKLRRYEQDVIGAKGRKVSGPKWDAKRNVYVWKFINPRGKEEEMTLEK